MKAKGEMICVAGLRQAWDECAELTLNRSTRISAPHRFSHQHSHNRRSSTSSQNNAKSRMPTSTSWALDCARFVVSSIQVLLFCFLCFPSQSIKVSNTSHHRAQLSATRFEEEDARHVGYEDETKERKCHSTTQNALEGDGQAGR